VTGNHGGARVGAGRKPITLAGLVAEGRFDAENRRHRELLAVGEVPEGLDGQLRVLVAAYRRAANRGDRSHLARAFAARLLEVSR